MACFPIFMEEVGRISFFNGNVMEYNFQSTEVESRYFPT